jgi:hypothetical protein
MARDWNDKAEAKTVGDDLAPYRRLVELQKQMIELAQQHEQSKRQHNALREQMMREITGRRPRRGLRHHLQRSASNLLKRVPGFAAEKPALGALNHKQPLSC